MRGKKAKALRKLVYDKKDFRERAYVSRVTKLIKDPKTGLELGKSIQVLNSGMPVKFETPKGEKRQLALRRIYQRLKPLVKGLPNKEIKKAVLGI